MTTDRLPAIDDDNDTGDCGGGGGGGKCGGGGYGPLTTKWIKKNMCG